MRATHSAFGGKEVGRVKIVTFYCFSLYLKCLLPKEVLKNLIKAKE